VAVIDNTHQMEGWCVSFPALSIEIFQAEFLFSGKNSPMANHQPVGENMFM
jgi:hypothetical protein